MTISTSALEACKQKEAIVIATEWREFREIDWQAVYANMTKPAFVFDGRLLVDADKLREIGFKARILSVFASIYTVADDVCALAGQGHRPRREDVGRTSLIHAHHLPVPPLRPLPVNTI